MSLRFDTSPDLNALVAATTRTFEFRFKNHFGDSMEIDFDRVTEASLQRDGFPNSKVFHLGTGKSKVRLGLLFDLIRLRTVNQDLFIKMEELATTHSLDRTVLPRIEWNRTAHSSIANLKHIYLLSLGTGIPSQNHLFSEYYYDPQDKSEHRLKANLFVERIIARMGKIFHIILADMAAPNYDKRYGKESFGTELAMDAEERNVQYTLEKLQRKHRAVELGCGTGRHTLMLASQFDEVVGYDFSNGMIEEARKKLRKKVLGGPHHKKKNSGQDKRSKIRFDVRDMEDVPLSTRDGHFDLVLGSFGMGSFVEDADSFLSSISNQMEKAGVCILSFYNRDALRYITPPPWRDSALSAELVRSRDELEVSLPTGEQFKIFCKSYTAEMLQALLGRHFGEVKLLSSSALASFLPEQLFSVGTAASRNKQVISKMDEILEQYGPKNGAYFLAICGTPIL